MDLHSKTIWNIKFTVKIMILFRLRYRPITATAYRDSPSATVTHSYLTVQHRNITIP